MRKRKRRWKRALGLLLFLAAAVGMGKVYPAEAGKETIEFPEVHQEEQIAQGLFVNYISLPDGSGLGTAWFQSSDGRTSICLQEAAGAPADGGEYTELGTEENSTLYNTFSEEAVRAVERILENSLLHQAYWEAQGIPMQCTRQNAQMAVWYVMYELGQPGSTKDGQMQWTTEMIKKGGLKDRIPGVRAVEQLERLIEIGLGGSTLETPSVEAAEQKISADTEKYHIEYLISGTYLSGWEASFQNLPEGSRLWLDGQEITSDKFSGTKGNGVSKLTLETGIKGNMGKEILLRVRGKTEKTAANVHFFKPGNAGKQWVGVISSVLSESGPEKEIRTQFPHLTGTLRLQKKDAAGKNLKGAVYGIYKDEDCGTLAVEMAATDPEGIAGTELPVGQYFVKEIKAPEGYQKDERIYPVEIQNSQICRLEVTDREQKVDLTIEKQDAETGEMLEGAAFSLYYDQAAEKFAAELEDLGGGKYMAEGLKPGTYFLKETEAPVGYETDGIVEKLLLSGDGSGRESVPVRLNRTNRKKNGSILVEKRDEDTETLLSGAVFTVFSDKECSRPAGVLEEGEQGYYHLKNLPQGIYYLRETKAPAGYEPSEETVEIRLDRWHVDQEYQISMTNQKAVRTMKITKRIRAEDIVWAHGNPVFFFRLEGRDMDGDSHSYSCAVEFTPEDLGTGKEYLEKTVTLDQIVAGIYRLTEQETYRYSLESYENIEGGKAEGEACVFDLIANEEGKAVAVNEKVNQSGTSHTGMIRNVFRNKQI